MPVALSNSLASIARKLSPTDAQRVWTFLAKFGENPAHPSLSLERIDKTKHDNLWSGRISDGLRAVIHKDGEIWTVLYVGQHDDAYNWAKTRTIERVLLTSFVTTLCHNLERNLQILCTPEELERITVTTVHKQAKDLLKASGESVDVVDDEVIKKLVEKSYIPGCPLDQASLWLEWESVIQAQGITTWNEYRTANRAGRGQPLSVKERKQVWQVIEQVLNTLQAKKQIDWSGLCRQARQLLSSRKVASPYDVVIVDELQDLRPQEIKLLAALAGEGRDRLMVLGDAGQRIYAGRFNLKALGIDVRGRSHVLRINYRTTEQIRSFADQIVGSSSDDLDGSQQERQKTISLLKGPEPVMQGFKTQPLQNQWIANQVSKLLSMGLLPNEIAIFARTNDLLKGIESSLKTAELPCHQLSREEESTSDTVNLGTMHRAKGLEFKVVFVINVSDELMPFPYAFKHLSDQQARDAAIERERQLLYVSVTRARDEVFVTWVGQPSRFLEEILTMPNPVKANPTRSMNV